MKVICGYHVLASNVKVADSFFKRFKGLMGKRAIENGEGLLLNTSSIHCFFMKMPIDAVYISKNMTVLGKETLNPWSLGKWLSGTKYVLELGEGDAEFVSDGDPVKFEY
jgi:uncharacterized membrane protein (UPF0127 family)